MDVKNEGSLLTQALACLAHADKCFAALERTAPTQADRAHMRTIRQPLSMLLDAFRLAVQDVKAERAALPTADKIPPNELN